MKPINYFLTLALLAGFSVLPNAAIASGPSNPDASPEARALLDLYYRISGRYTLTGQHNYPDTKDRNTRFAANYIGQTPVIWSSDMGFARDGDKDSYLARPEIVKEAIRQHRKGSIITICWHAVPPTADEPVTFMPLKDADPDSLASVQGRLPDRQFRDLLTPGTALYKRWTAQVDSVAVYLKQLRDAGVPVLWRPYHEMNGDWFWWGGRTGEYSTADLYRQLYDRYVHVHKLNNLIWVWNVDRPSTPIRKFSNFYPGNDYLDILSLDVYGSDFNQDYYDSLLALSHGKPILLGEVGNPPMPAILDKQPLWCSWVIWAGMVRNLTRNQHLELVNDPRILSQEDPAYWEVTAPYRKACGLPPLPLKSNYPVNFSGRWRLNEGRSQLGNRGAVNVPWEIDVDHENDVLHVTKDMIMEWENDRISYEDILLNGSEMRSEFFNSPRISTAGWDKNCNCIMIESKVKFSRGDRNFETVTQERWRLEDGGKTLRIIRTSSGFRGGDDTGTWVYDKLDR
jgi:mannan endo-1,4-beta-mannosidase